MSKIILTIYSLDKIIEFFENGDSQENVDLFILNYMKKLEQIKDEEVISNALILMTNFLSSDRWRIINRGVQSNKISDDKKNHYYFRSSFAGKESPLSVVSDYLSCG